MIDFMNIEKYKENNRIEAKKALGGLPNSIWETYSAFANTIGGIILLGVEEYKDKSLHTVKLPDPEQLVADFWNIVNDPRKVSVNILTDRDITIENAGDCRIVAIRVPRAQRSDKPVYIDGNPISGSYRRNGEGDYRCTKEEVHSMIRDASFKTQDMRVLENMGLDVFDYDSVHRYRIRMDAHRPEHTWMELDDVEFLYRLGAAGRDENGKMHPTAAGLLMFGYEYEIVREYPQYLLDYREQLDVSTHPTNRIVSSSGDWSGNLYDFYFRVYTKITRNIKIPLSPDEGERIDDTPVYNAVHEALANCLINADYHGRQGIVIIKEKDKITLSNPGSFRIDVETAKNGGISDPRNSALIKMFKFVDIGKRIGSGIPNIFNVWKKQGWNAPDISESFDPDRITLSLEFVKADNKKPTVKAENRSKMPKTAVYTDIIISYLTHNMSAECSDIATLIGLSIPRTRAILSAMISDGIIVSKDGNKNKVYMLK